MAYLMGIDVGTTGTKTLLINEKGAIVSTASEEYPLDVPRVGWSEQNPGDWWRATLNTIRKVLETSGVKGEKIKGIGLSGQMHGLVLLDKDHRVLRPCILWNDQRTARQCQMVTERIGRERLIEITCNPALTGFTIGKVLWVRENEPQVWEKTFKILLPKDYIRFLLTGSFATEVSDASGTLFLDVPKRKWSKELLRKLDIDISLLPECYESTVVSGRISEKVAQLTGLSKGTPVVGGGGDNAAGAVGCGIVCPGLALASLGTSGVVFVFSDSVTTDSQGRLHTFCHAVPGKWHVMGVMLSAGGSLRWFRDVLGEEEKREARRREVDAYEVLIEKAAKVAPGAEGLIFLPYLSGERTPYPDPDARGVFFGINLKHTKVHLIRAVMEGVTFGMRDSLEIIKGMGIPVEKVRASGGGARSLFWRQMQADIYDLPVETVNVTEGAAFGAALLAGTGVGIYSSVEEACRETIRTNSLTQPDQKRKQIYQEYYKMYRSLYPVLADKFKLLSQLVSSEKKR